LVVAANGPRSMRLAARFGEGWVTYGGVAEDMEGWWRLVAAAAERMRRELEAAGRDPAGFARYLSLDGAPVFSLSSVGFFADAVERAARLGFTDVITHWPRESSWYAGEESVLVEVAMTVLPQLRRVG
jgi:alkanesulfonate monooxygenase SsuD/methylene tetrahydromethanopterin reductase-like flavin-dependent oxidoreductase (luciferase family)